MHLPFLKFSSRPALISPLSCSFFEIAFFSFPVLTLAQRSPSLSLFPPLHHVLQLQGTDQHSLPQHPLLSNLTLRPHPSPPLPFHPPPLPSPMRQAFPSTGSAKSRCWLANRVFSVTETIFTRVLFSHLWPKMHEALPSHSCERRSNHTANCMQMFHLSRSKTSSQCLAPACCYGNWVSSVRHLCPCLVWFPAPFHQLPSCSLLSDFAVSDALAPNNSLEEKHTLKTLSALTKWIPFFAQCSAQTHAHTHRWDHLNRDKNIKYCTHFRIQAL